MLIAPVLQVAVPVPAPAVVEMILCMQTPVAVFDGLGRGTGAPR